MISLPKAPNSYSSPTWNQVNNSDVNGSLYASFNIDLTENEGKLRVGKRLVVNTSNSDDAALTSYPCGFKQFGIYKFAIAGLSGVGYAFSVTNPNGIYPSAKTFAKVTGSNTPTDVDSKYSDIEVSNDALYVSGKGDTVYKTTDGTNWTKFTAGTSPGKHMMTAFQARTYRTEADSKIISWDASDSVATSGAYTLELGNSDSNIITFIRSSSNRIWVGTINSTGGKGYIYEWDGTTTQPQKSYRMESAGVLSCVIKDDIPYVMDVYGTLSYWNGGTFLKVPNGSLNRINNKLLYNPTTFGSSLNDKFVHPNGMSIIKGKINILIDGRNFDNTTVINDTIEETIPSGVYEYDETHGLYHKHSIGLSNVTATITDYGQVKLLGVGALTEMNNANTNASRDGTFLAGASYYTSPTSTKNGIFYDNSNDNLQKGGYFITAKLPAVDSQGMPSVQNMYNNIYTIYKKLLDANDEITVKYRKEEISAVIATASWTWTNTFETTTDLSALVGYEVEPILGTGSGKTSHILSVVNNSGTYTVTVDENYPSATGGSSQIRVLNWKKISTIIQSQATYDQAGIGELANWIQFKVAMIFTGKDEIEKLLVVNQNYNSPT